MLDVLWFKALDEISKAHDLHRSKVIVLLAITTACNDKSFACYRELVELTGLHRATIYLHCYDLSGKGLINIRQPRRTLYYTPTIPGRQILAHLGTRYKVNRKKFNRSDYYQAIQDKPQEFYA